MSMNHQTCEAVAGNPKMSASKLIGGATGDEKSAANDLGKGSNAPGKQDYSPYAPGYAKG